MKKISGHIILWIIICAGITFGILKGGTQPVNGETALRNLATDTSQAPLQSIRNTDRFLSLSDLHFDPFAFPGLTDTLLRSPVQQWKGIFAAAAAKYGYGDYGDDTNYNLFLSALNKMRAVNPRPHFIVMTGDFISHDFGMNFQQSTGITNRDTLFSFVFKTLQFVTNTIESYFPGIPLLPALGNNDSYCGDYQAETSGVFYPQVGKLWYPLVQKLVSQQAFMRSFTAGGYYVASNPANSNHKIIVLNTVIYSTSFDATKYPNYCKTTPLVKTQKTSQLGWLRGQLQLCRQEKKKAWLVYHIPPGINAYSSSGGYGSCVQNITSFWNDSVTRVFTGLLAEYKDVVQLNMAGHTHMDNFELFTDSISGPYNFVHITPAISPIFNNSPAFEEITYNKQTAGWIDYTAYYLGNLHTTNPKPWDVEYNFSKAYGVTAITPQSLQQVYQKIYSDTAIRKQYITYYDASNPSFTAITPKNFMFYWCAIGSIGKQQYAGCACPK